MFQFGGGGPHLPDDPDAPVQWTAVLDGRPVTWAVRRRLHDKDVALLPGSELLPDLLGVAGERRLRVGLVGGSAATRTAWPASLRRDYPGSEPAGEWEVDWSWLDRPEFGAELATRIAAARVDMLVVSLGKPRQELWLRDHVAATGASLALPFGSAVDYIAGTKERPPQWAAEHGVEWLVRLVKEPRRLWKRYLVEGPIAVSRLRTIREL